MALLWGDIMTKERKAMLMMAICACLWSIGGLLFKYMSWSPFLIAGGRSLFSAMVMAIYMYMSKTKLNICKYSVGAGFSLMGVLICFVVANKLTTAANAIVLQYVAPIFVLIISIAFFHHKVHKKEVFIVGITLIGIVLFFFDELSPGNILGNFVAILAGLFFAIMLTVVGFGGGEDDSIRLSGVLIGHILTAIVGISIGIPMTETYAPMEFVLIVILGVLQLGIPYVLYGLASKDCSPLACSLIGMLEPILNPIWVLIFYGEVPGFYALIGGIIVIAAVTIWCATGDGSDTEKEDIILS